MADRHVVFKQCMKEMADRQGLSVTFMAKIASDQAGSSCHIHLSLWRDGKNAFAGETSSARSSAPTRSAGSSAAGSLTCPDVMVFYAPTVNSYKRYVDGSWAPTRLAWSHDNRTAGFRVVGEGNGLRIECRIPGADCNPYLAFAAALASGLDGIGKRIEPPDALQRRRLRGTRSAARAVHACRSDGALRGRAISRSARSAKTSSSTTCISSGPSSTPTTSP